MESCVLIVMLFCLLLDSIFILHLHMFDITWDTWVLYFYGDFVLQWWLLIYIHCHETGRYKWWNILSYLKDFTIPVVLLIIVFLLRYWWLRIDALAEGSDWVELEKMSKTKKPILGMEVWTGKENVVGHWELIVVMYSSNGCHTNYSTLMNISSRFYRGTCIQLSLSNKTT